MEIYLSCGWQQCPQRHTVCQKIKEEEEVEERQCIVGDIHLGVTMDVHLITQPSEGLSHEVHFSFQTIGTTLKMAAGIPPRASA